MYGYLKKFVNPYGRTIQIWNENIFISLEEEDIIKAENRLGFSFPEQLRQFYLEIGCGNLTTPENPPLDYKFYGENEILSPDAVAEIVTLPHNSGYISAEALDYMEPGDLPFFHVRDSCNFLVMRPKSDNPNAIYSDTGVLIEHEFNRFIWRLYYESPCYFERIIEAHYAALDQE